MFPVIAFYATFVTKKNRQFAVSCGCDSIMPLSGLAFCIMDATSTGLCSASEGQSCMMKFPASWAYQNKGISPASSNCTEHAVRGAGAAPVRRNTGKLPGPPPKTTTQGKTGRKPEERRRVQGREGREEGGRGRKGKGKGKEGGRGGNKGRRGQVSGGEGEREVDHSALSHRNAHVSENLNIHDTSTTSHPTNDTNMLIFLIPNIDNLSNCYQNTMIPRCRATNTSMQWLQIPALRFQTP